MVITARFSGVPNFTISFQIFYGLSYGKLNIRKFNDRTTGPVSLTRVLRICYNQWLFRKRSLKILNPSDLEQGQ